ncbi:hypothetical protein KCH_33190 [Kitasatospora cheerisanensis KCTC 2395]|uniref:Uncharacterized protein n=1 Tax=Kitasatospora cheerisanensis KCTC 2395 TaxID=1348663 RepID=A0A066YU97_9ACTN|nr:hypothetical protein KCH_33190 [Kitasatospora cheerisanensis KCTC 2395]
MGLRPLELRLRHCSPPEDSSVRRTTSVGLDRVIGTGRWWRPIAVPRVGVPEGSRAEPGRVNVRVPSF